ncbi:MAG: phenylalanine--tRNA ligase subunit alpha [Bacteroidales bacterium]|nr:phenylalanine--tRNA ligase subunit alpha [Bacteroidales bacterium]NLK82186.1 phenylalanine--tRNA ligase subunit alpha [Bacteroidales bacterium]HPY82860.1 phenylalanine--tRNA ligase subunit alpha [Bacteroidales bacterium]
MIQKIDELLTIVNSTVINDSDELEQFRLRFLSKKGELNKLFAEFKNVPPEQKREFGQKLNLLKNAAQEKFDIAQNSLSAHTAQGLNVDVSLPGMPLVLGSKHPLTIVKNQIIDIFSNIGFTVAEGPEIEDDWHVFSALNFPLEHPARDMQDTFFIESNPDIVLRTHTSSVQVRVMETTPMPVRSVFPGRVFRNEAISARAHCIFHQVEGLYIDENVSFADLKQTLLYFAKEMFGASTQIRLRPSYFPFTEPSAEMDISCSICGGKGCNVCKHSGWVEILGCGMVDPNVLKSSNIDSAKYTGFAFGMGVERIAMLKYQIKDIRLFFENDLRFLEQFKSVF